MDRKPTTSSSEGYGNTAFEPAGEAISIRDPNLKTFEKVRPKWYTHPWLDQPHYTCL
jgi:hypothetical protein